MSTATKTATVVPLLERRIYTIRGQRVMLDRDLAELYEVPTKRLNEQVRRNLGRFPKDFMIVLTKTEAANLKSQIAASSWGGSRKQPLAFTEHGVTMLSAVLNSQRAIRTSILVVRAFVKLREMAASDQNFALRLERVESAQDLHGTILDGIASEIKKIKAAPVSRLKGRIGFQPVG